MGRAYDRLDARALLIDLYSSAVRAAAPGPALEKALAFQPPVSTRPWIIALGKAAHPMTATAVRTLERVHLEPAGGVIVAPNEAGFNHPFSPSSTSPHPSIAIATGDHPEPGAGSLCASARIGEVARPARSSKEVWVLLSGGATSLAASPIDGVPPADLTALFSLLQRSGLDISAMNTVRKRFLRWGAGRLAAALAPARVRVFVVSDVIGDYMAAIGSGPCVPDENTAADVRRILADADLWQRTPETVRIELARTERDSSLETPKAGDECFRFVESAIIANNQTALDGAAERAAELGIQTVTHTEPISGDAASAGPFLVRTILDHRRGGTLRVTHGAPSCLIAGGETVVKLQEMYGTSRNLGREPPSGGRCQELALSAARALRTLIGENMALLAAGTDGRDGPTDAAGAIVDDATWDRIESAGRTPDDDLARHGSYRALDSVGALLRTGLTGTNVADIMIASVWSKSRDEGVRGGE